MGVAIRGIGVVSDNKEDSCSSLVNTCVDSVRRGKETERHGANVFLAIASALFRTCQIHQLGILARLVVYISQCGK